MHELALMGRVVAAVASRVRPARVARVRIQIGKLAGVLPETVQFCFAICARGTPLDGAALEIDEVRGRGHCRRCGADVTMETFVDPCACGSVEIDVVGGKELRIETMEVQ
jgi:hydrogenase nickel incorporation protein HypA/HybF